MGFYDRWILPTLLDRIMRQSEIERGLTLQHPVEMR